MANIPIQQTPAVEARPVGTPYQRLDTRGAFGEPIVEALGQARQAVGQAADAYRKAKGEADAAATVEALSKFGDTTNSALYDEKRGFLNTQGKNALAASASTYEGLQRAAKDLEDGLANDEQRQAFRAHVTRDLQQLYRQIEGHSAQQSQVVERDAYQARTKTSLDSVGKDPALLDTQILAMQGPLRAFSHSQGHDEATARELLSGYKERATATALDSLLASNAPDAATRAREVFDLHGDDLGTKRGHYEGLIKAAGLKADAETLHGEIIGAAKPAESPWGPTATWADEEQARRAVERIPDDQPELKERVRSLVEHSIAADRDNKSQAAAERFNRSQVALERRGSWNDIAPADLAYLQDPRNDKVAGDFFVVLKHRARQLASEGRASRAERNREQEEANKIARERYFLASEEGLDAATQIKLAEQPWFRKADEPTRIHIQGLQAKHTRIIAGGGLAPYNESLGFFKRALGPLKMSKGDSAQAVEQFDEWYQRTSIDKKGEPITQQDVNLKVGEMLMLGDAEGGKGSWLSRDRRRFQVEPDEAWQPLDEQDNELPRAALKAQRERASSPVPEAPTPQSPVATRAVDIPEEQRALVARELAASKRFKALGRAPTESEVVAGYNRLKAAGKLGGAAPAPASNPIEASLKRQFSQQAVAAAKAADDAARNPIADRLGVMASAKARRDQEAKAAAARAAEQAKAAAARAAEQAKKDAEDEEYRRRNPDRMPHF